MSKYIDKVGIGLFRVQPVTLGHCYTIDYMAKTCKTVIIGLGSANGEKDERNPWSVADRTTMLRNIYGDRIKIVPFADIGSKRGTNAWCDYVLDKIGKLGLPDPTDYFSGSEEDALWYTNHFYYGNVSDDNIPDNFKIKGITRKLHIMDRFTNPYPISATSIRRYLSHGNDGWKQWVPEVNHELVETTFPDEFKLVK